MTSVRVMFPLLLGITGFFSLIPVARADSFGFYNAGAFQFDSMAISGNAEGTCEGQCVPWGDIVILDVSFVASVVDYQDNVSCANNACETQITGSFGPGSVTANLAVYDDSSQSYYLKANSLQGSFKSHFCTGRCGSYRAETELSLDFEGAWNNNWYSNGTIQMECFQNGGCDDGTGAGTLNTESPEPSDLALLAGGIPCVGVAVRRKLSQATMILRASGPNFRKGQRALAPVATRRTIFAS